MTHKLEKPAASAAAATDDSRPAISPGPPPQVKLGTCKPKCRGIGSSFWRAASSGAETSEAGTRRTGPGG
jgi:hypothetical protein